MAFLFLRYLSELQLPVSVSDSLDIAKLKGLERSGYVVVVFDRDDRGRATAQVTSVTDKGRSMLNSLKQHSALHSRSKS